MTVEYKEYKRLTEEDLLELNFTGEWEKDKVRFVKEYRKNFEALNFEEIEEYE